MRSRSAKTLPKFGQLDDIIDYERGLNTGETVCKPYTTHKIHELATVQEKGVQAVSDVKDISNNMINIGNGNMVSKEINCFYIVYGERKDVDRFEVEYENKV